MANVAAISAVALVFLCLKSAFGDYGGWEGGHATFYGGGDASGTMGKSKKWSLVFAEETICLALARLDYVYSFCQNVHWLSKVTNFYNIMRKAIQ